MLLKHLLEFINTGNHTCYSMTNIWLNYFLTVSHFLLIHFHSGSIINITACHLYELDGLERNIPRGSRTQIYPFVPKIHPTLHSKFMKCSFWRFTKLGGTTTRTPFVNLNSTRGKNYTFPYRDERVCRLVEPLSSTFCTSAYKLEKLFQVIYTNQVILSKN